MSAPGTISEIVYRADSAQFVVVILGSFGFDYFTSLVVRDADDNVILTLYTNQAAFVSSNPATWQWSSVDSPIFEDGLSYTVELKGGSFTGGGTPIEGVIHWPHLDLGSIGQEKQMIGLDLVATAPTGVLVSIGYNQNDLSQATDPYQIDADTLIGQLFPFPVTAPSFDLRIYFGAGQKWQWDATNLYVQDLRMGS